MNATVVELFDGVDDLIRRVAHTECPEIRRARARVHAALVLARNASEKRAAHPPVRSAAGPAASASGDASSTQNGGLPALNGHLPTQNDQLPTQTLGVALLLGLGLGLMTHSRR
jgi:ElaB/YqjD/DUF883 family membrane-anchored ribosome-binding protein